MCAAYLNDQSYMYSDKIEKLKWKQQSSQRDEKRKSFFLVPFFSRDRLAVSVIKKIVSFNAKTSNIHVQLA